MSEAKQRDWVDTVSKLLLPVVIFALGIIFSCQKDKNDRATQEFERDSNYVKMLISTNEKERDLGLKMVEVRQKEGKFSPALIPVVVAFAGGPPGDPSTQTAQRILNNAASQNPEVGAQITRVAQSLPHTVYIQIAKEDQRPDAKALQSELRQANFASPGIELVPKAPTNNGVRYYSAADKVQAGAVAELMKKLGFTMPAQPTHDFSKYSSGAASPYPLEVWIGQDQGPLPASK